MDLTKGLDVATRMNIAAVFAVVVFVAAIVAGLL